MAGTISEEGGLNEEEIVYEKHNRAPFNCYLPFLDLDSNLSIHGQGPTTPAA
ncbi:hypothetical protein DBT_1076 [Dissulfuribacter thermophilus]|uniref:Uncharacterized protein n=1 Tax=Dissulfuribacter thermophilus TaxID=1156395 RepID=A0A1B9F5W9_9BACT|nr:hypothetical protein DBT_1076 [Dissulfuribacter thermophilus]